jgi:hypothetical protein
MDNRIGRYEHTQLSTAITDWPIFSSDFGMSRQKRAYEPIHMFQIVSCAECDVQNGSRSTAEHFGILDSQSAVLSDYGAPSLENDLSEEACLNTVTGPVRIDLTVPGLGGGGRLRQRPVPGTSQARS